MDKIRAEGPMTFEEFMEMALYDPDYGYYVSGKTRIGRGGDYYTSPHLHKIFGALIGKQIKEMWDLMGRPRDFKIIELAPGAGFLCADILNSLKGSDFFESLEYFLVERTAGQREKQKNLLAEFSDRVKWFSSLTEIDPIGGCILSNELLDAFPVHLVRMEDELKEIYVGIDGSHFAMKPGPLSSEVIRKYFGEFSDGLERGYETEANTRIRGWLKEVHAAIEKGFVLTIDYGYSGRDYYSEDRNRGTLLCYHGHQANENPLQNVGEQDITAHVNFSSVKKWGEEIGLEAVGFCGQGAFLVSLGIEEEIQKLTADKENYIFDIAKIKRLVLPQGMGESHMVMAQYKGEGRPSLRGFSIRNQLRYL